MFILFEFTYHEIIIKYNNTKLECNDRDIFKG